ncbi:porin family protein [Prevotella sp. 10(H)]|uniref:porin family protein n=1 Tax=Prevotella sp. 10(H) TaxID=1158294 RepID=UPI0004A7138E|nr:porin family protein [Prevotella sp. 10(H)]
MTSKHIVLLLLSTLFAIIVNGQNKKFEAEWNVGVGFGPTFSSVSFDPGVSTKNKQQFHGGLAIRYISEKNLGLIAELNYTQQGWEQNWKENPLMLEHSHQLNYIELPILTHIYFGNKVRFFVNLGPKIGYLISDSEKMNQALTDLLQSGNLPANEMTHQYYRMAERKLDYSLMGGMGLEFRTGIGYFALEGRYTFGLGDIYNNKKSDFFNRSANRVISAKLTYYVKLF